MKSNIKTHLKHRYKELQELLEEYDYQIMAAKDEAVLYVIEQISQYLITTHKYLIEQETMEINIDKDICKLDLIVNAQQIFELSTLLKFVNKSIAKKFRAINICSKTEDRYNFSYRVIFDDSLSLIIIENKDKELLLNLNEHCIIENTFSDNETDAILFTLSFITIGFSFKDKSKKEECKIIQLSDYKK